jgi:hypothetical protein
MLGLDGSVIDKYNKTPRASSWGFVFGLAF